MHALNHVTLLMTACMRQAARPARAPYLDVCRGLGTLHFPPLTPV